MNDEDPSLTAPPERATVTPILVGCVILLSTLIWLAHSLAHLTPP